MMLDNDYTYDYVGNITQLINTAVPVANKMGGNYTFNYQYDKLNRLASANGSFSGYSGSGTPTFGDLSANFSLNMQYDNLHNITQKTQNHNKNNAVQEANTYANVYNYSQSKPHQLTTIQNGAATESFVYDANGNLKEHNSEDDWLYFWDESNRLRSAVLNEGKMMHYIYDSGGERTLKAITEYHGIFENGTPADGGATLGSYTTYPSPYITIAPNKVYTKHYFAGTQRVASKPAGLADIFEISLTSEFDDLIMKQLGDIQAVSDTVGLGELTLKDTDPGTIAPAIYFFHPDHLGSSTMISDGSGYAYQMFLNLPFGESMAEQRRSGNLNNPYKFNGKELDEETDLYYYGARYYNPKISNWLSVDPIALWQPVQESEHYILGQHNGGYFNPKNMSVYGYTYQSPIIYVDPNGKQNIPNSLAGIYAHRALATYVRRQDPTETRWKAERSMDFGLSRFRPDIQYNDGNKGATWELKSGNNFFSASYDSFEFFQSSTGMLQNKFYAEQLTRLTGIPYSTGSSNGTPYPIESGTALTDEKSGLKFQYIIPIGDDGMIYWYCMNCSNKKIPQPGLLPEPKGVPLPPPAPVLKPLRKSILEPILRFNPLLLLPPPMLEENFKNDWNNNES